MARRETSKSAGQLVNVPTDALIDMMCVKVAGGVLTASDLAEIEHMQRELQRRAHDSRETWM